MGRSQVYMSSYIAIGNCIFKQQINSVTIHSSWKTLADTAEIKLPNLPDESGVKLEKLVKVGDPVLIKLGYDDELNAEFEGYIAKIIPGSPVGIICEDEMWKLKQISIKKSWRSIKLSDMLYEILPAGSVVECPEMVLAPYRIDRISIAKAMEQLKEEFGLVAYFRGGKLYVGLEYQEKNLGEVNYHFQKNAIMNNLEFRRKEDIKVKIIADSILPNGTHIKAEYGEEDGDTIKIPFYNKTITELKQLAKHRFDRIKFDGYKGSFTAKGIPIPKHGMVANLMDNKYPERAGSFFIDSIQITYNGESGFSREIELGRSAAATAIMNE